jgi:hypothetical protein
VGETKEVAPSPPSDNYRHLLAQLGLTVWMLGIMMIHTVLYGPSEFWDASQRLGLTNVLRRVQAWLVSLFSAEYMAP